MTDLHHRIAERAYFASLAGVGADDLDRWLTAEAREMPSGIAAEPATIVAVTTKPKRKTKADAARR